jgi:hypothetical protein
MKTLLERLKPEVMELLDVEAQTYPTIIKGIKGNLSQRYYVTEISLGTVSDLSSVKDLQEFMQAETFSDMYLINNVRKLFGSAE